MREVRRRAAVVIFAASLWSVLAAAPAAAFDDAAFNEAAGTILCDCGCHPQSVAACTCGRAAEMRDEIRTMVASGMTGRQVIDDFVARYGEKILIAPEATGFNLLAWLGPLGLLVGGLAALVVVVRRLSRRGPAGHAADAPPAAPVAADEPYAARLRREVEELR
ncbi:MAG TPA: cytochrome c-type biogenesis protein CcmH [Candidatus Polarisedimenticolaceae bacterium]|nr:cytochrome c-type biogenesis protein CcmH [Candidatus Polarisedimenticolaceae bacterium]